MKTRGYLWKLILSASLIAGLLLTACEGTGTDQTEEDTATTITIMTPVYFNLSLPDAEMVEEIEKRVPGVNIRLQTYPEQEYYTVLRARLATGHPPDMFYIQKDYAGFNSATQLAASGYLEQISDLPEVNELEKQGLSSLLMRADDREVYGVAVAEQAMAVAYHRDIFDKYGLSVPKDWDEFLACCEKLKQNNVTPLIAGNKDSDGFQSGLYQIAANRINALNQSYDANLLNGNARITDKGTWDTVLTMYTDLYKVGYFNQNSFDMDGREASERFMNGEAAMTFSVLEHWRVLPDPDKEIGYFPLPANEAGHPTYVSLGYGGGLGISRSSTHKEECREVLACILHTMKPVEIRTMDAPEHNPFVQAYVHGYYAEPSNYYWRNEPEVVMMEKVSEYLAGTGTTIADITDAMQREFDKP